MAIGNPLGLEFQRTGDRIVPNETVARITSFFMLYILIFVLGTAIISLEGIDF